MYDPFEDKELIKMIGERLSRIAAGRDDEFDPEPFFDEDARWGLRIDMPDEASDYFPYIGVSFMIMDSIHWDGSGDPEWDVPENRGFNVGWDSCLEGGAILAQCFPYNYTDGVWTQDKAELWDRAMGTIDTLERWVARKGWEDN